MSINELHTKYTIDSAILGLNAISIGIVKEL
jgi:hypothetical protein